MMNVTIPLDAFTVSIKQKPGAYASFMEWFLEPFPVK